MSWTSNMNASMEYIEDHLADEIQMEDAAKIALCSVSNYEKIFSYIVGEPINTYIRKRRLSLAAMDLLHGNDTILTVAVKYGYRSQDSFARAFKKQYGVLPSVARKEKMEFPVYERKWFTDSVLSHQPLELDRIISMPQFTATGYYDVLPMKEPMKRASQFWTESLINGHSPEKEDPIYIIGVAGESCNIPEEMMSFALPAAHWLVFHSDEKKKIRIKEIYEQFYTEWLPAQNKYELRDLPAVEIFGTMNQEEVWFAIW